VRVSKLAAGFIVAIALLWSAALVSAKVEHFKVQYTGAGTLSSTLESQTSPECGEVSEVRTENTHFSWVTEYQLGLVIGRLGMGGNSDKHQADPSSLVSNDSTITLKATGCQPGSANCSGESQPQTGHEALLDIPEAGPRGASRVKVQAVGGFVGFTGKAFSGDWNFTSGSCAISYNDTPLLQPEFAVPGELEAQFPVKVATLKSLKVGHYFKVKISPGHYAPPHPNDCSADDGCLTDDFDFHGVVKFTRDG
jgi:hypothetical protein